MIIRTIDAHVSGAALRLVVEGGPALEARTLAGRLEELGSAHDAFRRALMSEPRGHSAMSGALLLPPDSTEADAGVIFMHTGGWSALCGHGVIAVATIAASRGLIAGALERGVLRFDTAAGPVLARLRTAADLRPARITGVAWSGVAARVVCAGLSVPLARRRVLVDVASAGETYAIVDAESAGVALDPDHVPEMRRTAKEIAEAVEVALTTPVQAGHEEVPPPDAVRVAGTVLTGPPAGSADLRCVVVYDDGSVDRSPGGLAACAVMAVLDAMGLIRGDQPLALESLIGTTLIGRVTDRLAVGDRPAILPEVEGRAFIIGDHAFVIDDEDPLRDGFVL
jgi:proline racemase